MLPDPVKILEYRLNSAAILIQNSEQAINRLLRGQNKLNEKVYRLEQTVEWLEEMLDK